MVFIFLVLLNSVEISASGHNTGPPGLNAGPSGDGAGPSGHGAGPSVHGLPEELRPYLKRTYNAKSTWDFYYEGHQVGVWLTWNGTIAGVGLESGNIYPSMNLPRNYHIKTYLAEKYDIFFLVYTLPNGYIVGMKNMKYNAIASSSSEGAVARVSYGKYKIMVWADDDGVEREIRLEPRNIIPRSAERRKYQIKIDFIDEVGLRFYAFKLLSGYIIGVTLGPLSND